MDGEQESDDERQREDIGGGAPSLPVRRHRRWRGDGDQDGTGPGRGVVASAAEQEWEADAEEQRWEAGAKEQRGHEEKNPDPPSSPPPVKPRSDKQIRTNPEDSNSSSVRSVPPASWDGMDGEQESDDERQREDIGGGAPSLPVRRHRRWRGDGDQDGTGPGRGVVASAAEQEWEADAEEQRWEAGAKEQRWEEHRTQEERSREFAAVKITSARRDIVALETSAGPTAAFNARPSRMSAAVPEPQSGHQDHDRHGVQLLSPLDVADSERKHLEDGSIETTDFYDHHQIDSHRYSKEMARHPSSCLSPRAVRCRNFAAKHQRASSAKAAAAMDLQIRRAARRRQKEAARRDLEAQGLKDSPRKEQDQRRQEEQRQEDASVGITSARRGVVACNGYPIGGQQIVPETSPSLAAAAHARPPRTIAAVQEALRSKKDSQVLDYPSKHKSREHDRHGVQLLSLHGAAGNDRQYGEEGRIKQTDFHDDHQLNSHHYDKQIHMGDGYHGLAKPKAPHPSSCPSPREVRSQNFSAKHQRASSARATAAMNLKIRRAAGRHQKVRRQKEAVRLDREEQNDTPEQDQPASTAAAMATESEPDGQELEVRCQNDAAKQKQAQVDLREQAASAAATAAAGLQQQSIDNAKKFQQQNAEQATNIRNALVKLDTARHGQVSHPRVAKQEEPDPVRSAGRLPGSTMPPRPALGSTGFVDNPYLRRMVHRLAVYPAFDAVTRDCVDFGCSAGPVPRSSCTQAAPRQPPGPGSLAGGRLPPQVAGAVEEIQLDPLRKARWQLTFPLSAVEVQGAQEVLADITHFENLNPDELDWEDWASTDSGLPKSHISGDVGIASVCRDEAQAAYSNEVSPYSDLLGHAGHKITKEAQVQEEAAGRNASWDQFKNDSLQATEPLRWTADKLAELKRFQAGLGPAPSLFDIGDSEGSVRVASVPPERLPPGAGLRVAANDIAAGGGQEAGDEGLGADSKKRKSMTFAPADKEESEQLVPKSRVMGGSSVGANSAPCSVYRTGDRPAAHGLREAGDNPGDGDARSMLGTATISSNETLDRLRGLRQRFHAAKAIRNEKGQRCDKCDSTTTIDTVAVSLGAVPAANRNSDKLRRGPPEEGTDLLSVPSGARSQRLSGLRQRVRSIMTMTKSVDIEKKGITRSNAVNGPGDHAVSSVLPASSSSARGREEDSVAS